MNHRCDSHAITVGGASGGKEPSSFAVRSISRLSRLPSAFVYYIVHNLLSPIRPLVARPRQFDVEVALGRAMQAFWAKGYGATSLDDLCEATGLGRSSLYAAFGDKRRLYLRALGHYQEGSAARVAAALARPLPIRKAIAAFLGQLIEEIAAGPGRRGCFIGNCAAELAGEDRGAASQVRRSLQRIEAEFRKALARAKARGELAVAADVGALARFLTAGVQGLRLLGKASPDRGALNDVAKVMLRCLDP